MQDASKESTGSIRQAVRRNLAVSKRDLLLFDRVRVMGLEDLLRSAPDENPPIAADVEYLATQGIVLDAPSSAHDVAQFLLDHLWDEAMEAARDGDEHLSPAVRHALTMGSSGRHPANADRGRYRLPPGGETVVAFALGFEDQGHASPVMDHRPSREDWRNLHTHLALPEDFGTTASESLLEVVLQELPVPSDEVSLQDVIDFTSDDETVRRRNRLLLSIERAELERKSAEEYSLEVREALHEFTQHMRLADLRMRQGVVRVLVSTGLGVAEELLHLRPRGALSAALTYRTMRTDRLEAELRAPGQEVAFIYETRRQFNY